MLKSYQKRFLIIFAILPVLEILISKYEFHPFIRGLVGDILVIPLLYVFLKIFFKISSEKLLGLVLLLAFGIELKITWDKYLIRLLWRVL